MTWCFAGKHGFCSSEWTTLFAEPVNTFLMERLGVAPTSAARLACGATAEFQFGKS
jgi:hypothetical protein